MRIWKIIEQQIQRSKVQWKKKSTWKTQDLRKSNLSKRKSFDDYIIGTTSKKTVFTRVSLLRPEFFLDFY